MSKLWHNWWIVGLANGEIDALGVVAWTGSCSVSGDPVRLLESLNTDTVSEQSQCVTDKPHRYGTVWDHSLADALILYEHLDSWEFLQFKSIQVYCFMPNQI